MSAPTTAKKYCMPAFEFHSLLLLTAVALALSTLAAQAQTTHTPSATGAPGAAVLAVSAAAPIAANKTTLQQLEAAFNRADTNRDNRLSPQEAERFPMIAQHFDRVDSDHDNFISRSEFNQAAGN